MNALLYVITIVLVLLCVELLILIIEVVKLSSSVQNNLNNHLKRDGMDNSTLLSLLSHLNYSKGSDKTDATSRKRDEYEEELDDKKLNAQHLAQLRTTRRSSDENAEEFKGQEDESASQPEKKSSSQEAFVDDAAQKQLDATGPWTGESTTAEPATAFQRPTNAATNRDVSPETETKAVNFSVRKCPECERENSAFRKECFFCNAVLEQ